MKDEEVFKILELLINDADDPSDMEDTVLEHLSDHRLDIPFLAWREKTEDIIAERIHSKLSMDELNMLFKWHKQKIIFDMFDTYL